MNPRSLLLSIMLACGVANAQSYTCPTEAAGARLTNAKVLMGAPSTPYALHGDIEQVQGGSAIRYNFTDEAPRWLQCQYGGKRVEGTAISGAEVIGGRDVRFPLDTMTTVCELSIRKTGRQGRDERWAAALSCKRRLPPPPDMCCTT